MLHPDREFYAAAVMQAFNDPGEGCYMPCRGTPPVRAAYDEFAAGRRGRVSEAVIRGEKITVPYTMYITERKREKVQGAKEEDVREPPPHKRFIAFAANRPDTGPDSYSARQGHRGRIPHDREL